jgi:hypothetical protein
MGKFSSRTIKKEDKVGYAFIQPVAATAAATNPGNNM